MANKGNKNTLTKYDITGAKEKYAEWLAFPSIIRKMEDSNIRILGINPDEIDPILKITTRVELSKVIGFSRESMNRWEGETEFRKIREEKELEYMGKQTPNVMAAFYKGAIKEGDAPRMKLWMQIYRKFVEKQEQKHTVDLDAVKELTQTIKGFLNK